MSSPHRFQRAGENETHFRPTIPVVCTQYANRNGLLMVAPSVPGIRGDVAWGVEEEEGESSSGRKLYHGVSWVSAYLGDILQRPATTASGSVDTMPTPKSALTPSWWPGSMRFQSPSRIHDGQRQRGPWRFKHLVLVRAPFLPPHLRCASLS
jgi:hypothetical protein